MLFSSERPAPAATFHLASQRRDKSRSVTRQRGIPAIQHIGLKHGWFGDIEGLDARPLIGGKREFIDDRNSETV
jgi:hypothetical protein